MGSVRRRLGRLEQMNPGEERLPRSPEHVYARMREEARESNAELWLKAEGRS